MALACGHLDSFKLLWDWLKPEDQTRFVQEQTAIDTYSWTLLSWAIHSGSIEATDYILSLKFEDMGLHSQNPPVLQAAISRGHLNLIRHLLELGADPNVQSTRYYPPLVISIRRGLLDVVKTLVEFGHANIHYRDRLGKSTIQIAENCGQHEVAAYLRSVAYGEGQLASAEEAHTVPVHAEWLRPRLCGEIPPACPNPWATVVGSRLLVMPTETIIKNRLGGNDHHSLPLNILHAQLPYTPDLPIISESPAQLTQKIAEWNKSAEAALASTRRLTRPDVIALTVTAPSSLSMELNQRRQSWSRVLTSELIQIDSDGMELSYIPESVEAPGQAHGVKPFSSKLPVAYFEITVLNLGRYGYLAIGMSQSTSTDKEAHLGWTSSTYGWHADIGCIFHNSGQGTAFSERWKQGDVVGCGIDWQREQIFWTLNGQYMGTSPGKVDVLEVWYPSVSMQSHGERIRANFGEEPFLFNFTAPTLHFEKLLVEPHLDQSTSNGQIIRVPTALSKYGIAIFNRTRFTLSCLQPCDDLDQGEGHGNDQEVLQAPSAGNVENPNGSTAASCQLDPSASSPIDDEKSANSAFYELCSSQNDGPPRCKWVPRRTIKGPHAARDVPASFSSMGNFPYFTTPTHLIFMNYSITSSRFPAQDEEQKPVDCTPTLNAISWDTLTLNSLQLESFGILPRLFAGGVAPPPYFSLNPDRIVVWSGTTPMVRCMDLPPLLAILLDDSRDYGTQIAPFSWIELPILGQKPVASFGALAHLERDLCSVYSGYEDLDTENCLNLLDLRDQEKRRWVKVRTEGRISSPGRFQCPAVCFRPSVHSEAINANNRHRATSSDENQGDCYSLYIIGGWSGAISLEEILVANVRFPRTNKVEEAHLSALHDLTLDFRGKNISTSQILAYCRSSYFRKFFEENGAGASYISLDAILPNDADSKVAIDAIDHILTYLNFDKVPPETGENEELLNAFIAAADVLCPEHLPRIRDQLFSNKITHPSTLSADLKRSTDREKCPIRCDLKLVPLASNSCETPKSTELESFVLGHCYIAALRSDFFLPLVVGNYMESKVEQGIRSVAIQADEPLLRMFWDGLCSPAVDLDQVGERIIDLFELSHALQANELALFLEKIISENIDADNVSMLETVAVDHSADLLKKACAAFRLSSSQS